MKRFQNIAIAALTATATVLSNPALVQAQESSYCQAGNYVIFGNGVWNDFDTASAGALELASRVGQQVNGTNLADTITYGVAHNPTSVATKGLLDLLETWYQNEQTDTSQFWRAISGLELLPDFLQDSIAETANAVDAAIVQGNPAVQQHVNKYNAFLGEGNKVVLVAHSQGNLFANIAYLGINDEYRTGFGIVSVGNPDSFTAGGGPYTTIDEDIIIRPIPGSRPANLDNFFGINGNDLSGHTFLDSYLAQGRPAESRILGHVVSSLGALEAPDTGITNGIITATLTWGGEPDVDLHVFEPNGTHVYYSNRAGQSGFLDADDTTSFGPEHYYVSCETIEVGTYRIGVNYYRGSSPENATVNLKAGELISEQTRTLGTAVGSSGNSSPIMVYNLDVTGSAEEGYEFLINPL